LAKGGIFEGRKAWEPPEPGIGGVLASSEETITGSMIVKILAVNRVLNSDNISEICDWRVSRFSETAEYGNYPME
jgi:hypothetical protein